MLLCYSIYYRILITINVWLPKAQNENAQATMINSVNVKGSDMITSDLSGFIK